MTDQTEKLFEANDLLNAAEHKLQEGLLKEATLILEQSKALYPDFAPTYNHFGWIYAYHFSQYEQAKEEYQMALKLDPNYPHTYFNYASLLCNLQEYEKAEEILKAATNKPSVNKSKAFNELGCILEMQGKFDTALDQFRKALLYSFHPEELNENQSAVKRCQMKQSLIHTQD